MQLKKIVCLLAALLLLTAMLTGCGEKLAEATTTTANADVTTTVGDDVTTTVGDEITTTVGDEITTTVGDEVTTTVGDEVTTTVGDEVTTTVGDEVTTTGGEGVTTTTKDNTTVLGDKGTTTKVTTTKRGDTTTKNDPWQGGAKKTTTKRGDTTKQTTTEKVTTTTTKKTTTTTGATTKVYGTTMYVDWDPETRMLQVVQKYSKTHDLVSIIKPIAPNQILNFVSPKLIANTGSNISNNLAGAKHIVSMPESDWLGPHLINGDWHGGSHGAGGTSTPSGESTNVVLKVNGKATSGNVSTYAGEVTLSYTNQLWHSSTKAVFMTEHYELTFDGEKWSVGCNIKLLENATSWNAYYGMQCTYGAWVNSIAYGSDAPVSLADAGGNTASKGWNCDTMTLRGNDGHAIELKLDRTYGLGRGTMIDKATSAGAFTAAYPHPNGKAYFLLVNGGRNPSANAKFFWRGTYRFFNEA